jgi:hypothetical protein
MKRVQLVDSSQLIGIVLSWLQSTIYATLATFILCCVVGPLGLLLWPLWQLVYLRVLFTHLNEEIGA